MTIVLNYKHFYLLPLKRSTRVDTLAFACFVLRFQAKDLNGWEKAQFLIETKSIFLLRLTDWLSKKSSAWFRKSRRFWLVESKHFSFWLIGSLLHDATSPAEPQSSSPSIRCSDPSKTSVFSSRFLDHSLCFAEETMDHIQCEYPHYWSTFQLIHTTQGIPKKTNLGSWSLDCLFWLQSCHKSSKY